MDPENRIKVFLITGANSGIGKAASIQLVRTGAKVVMACRLAEHGRQAVEDVRKGATIRWSNWCRWIYPCRPTIDMVGRKYGT